VRMVNGINQEEEGYTPNSLRNIASIIGCLLVVLFG